MYKNGGQVGGVEPALEFDSINLHFRNILDNNEINLDLDRNSTVLQIKNILIDHFQVPVANIRLVYAGAQIPNNTRLNYIEGIEDNDVIGVIVN